MCKIYYNKNKSLGVQERNEDANDQAAAQEKDAEFTADDTMDEPQQLVNSNVAAQTFENGAMPDSYGLNHHQSNAVGDGVRPLANWMESD